jgi:hypothetical protein
MITLPTEVSDNKDLVSSKPILLIDFVNKSFEVGSKAYTASSPTTTFEDLLKRGLRMSMGQSLPQLINGISSISPPTIIMTDWRGNLRTNLIQSNPYLGDVNVHIYLKYDSGVTTLANGVIFYKGVGSTWSEQNDIMTVKLKNPFAFDDIGTLLKDVDSKTYAGNDIIKPYQFGDFNWATDPRYWGERTNPYAICPLHFALEEDQSQTWTWYVSGHLMDTMPTAANLETEEGNAYAFVVRDKKSVHVKFDTGAVTVTNGASAAYIEAVLDSHECHLYEPFTAAGSENNVTHGNTIDGLSSTKTTLTEDGPDVLHLIEPDFRNLTENQGFLFSSYVYPVIHVRYGTITSSLHTYGRRKKGDSWSTGNVGSAQSNSWVSYELASTFTTLAELYDFEFKVEHNAAAGAIVEVIEVIVSVQVQAISTGDNFLYLRCKGMEYSGTWNSRFTSGALIENPASVVEALLRDEWSQADADIDMDSFDAVNTAYSSIDACGTIYQQKTARSLLSDLCSMFTWGLVYSQIKKWRLINPMAADNNFENSGTGTPGAQDIITDDDTISGSPAEYTNHPIKKGSFAISRSSERDFYGLLLIHHHYTHQGYLESTSVGSGRIKTINNWLLANSGSAVNYRAKVDAHYQNQKHILRLDTFYNAIAVEVGDILQVRHDDLNDAMLNLTVNTAKYVVSKVGQNWHPNTINLELIELF